MVSRKLRRAAVSWFRWKVPQWAGALSARQNTRAHPARSARMLTGWGHLLGPTVSRVTRELSQWDVCTSQFYGHIECERIAISAGMLSLKDPHASPKCYWSFLACSLPFTPTEKCGEGRPALPQWKGCKTVTSFMDGRFTVRFLPTRNTPDT